MMKLISRLSVVQKLGTSRATLDRWLNAKHKYYREDFPKPIRNGRHIFFVEEEIEQYIVNLKRNQPS